MQISGGSRLICIISSIFDEKPRLNYFYPHQELRDSRENVTKYQVSKDSSKMWFCHGGCKFDESNCQCAQVLATFFAIFEWHFRNVFSQWRLSSKLGMLSWGNFLYNILLHPQVLNIYFFSHAAAGCFESSKYKVFRTYSKTFFLYLGYRPPKLSSLVVRSLECRNIVSFFHFWVYRVCLKSPRLNFTQLMFTCIAS